MNEFQNSAYEFDRLCADIIKIDDNIEMVVVLNNKGRSIEMIARDNGIDSEFSPQKKEMLFMQTVLKSSMNKEHDDELGSVQGTMMKRERFTVYSFDFLNYVIMVITRPAEPVRNMINEITTIIQNMRRLELIQ